ncbi:MAG: DUF3098 domain-containing protein [Bacteroidota bacterium]
MAAKKTGKKRTNRPTPAKRPTSSTPKRVVKSSPKKQQETPAATSKPTPSRPLRPKTARSESSKSTEQLPFGRMNYILLMVGVAILIVGFFLLSLDPFIDATEFSISLYVAPLIIMAGFIEIIFAIMYQPKNEVPKTDQ